MLTKKIDESIENFISQKSYSNKASKYLPVGPQLIKDQDLNWKIVHKNIYERLLGLHFKEQTFNELFEKISESITNNRETRELKQLVENVYLNESALKAISPYTYLICDDKAKARTVTMSSVLGAMMSGINPLELNFTGTNFIEEIINSNFKSLCTPYKPTKLEHAYLPFLAKAFSNDLVTLSGNTEWLLDEFRNLVELYSFLYVIQLSVHLSEPSFRFEQPSSREIYFILETERASKERHECTHRGFYRIFSNKNGYALNVFPHLGYLELLTDLPIWKLLKESSGEDVIKVNKLNYLICEQFDISYSGDRATFKEAINDGLMYHRELFKKTSKSSDRYGANDKVCTVLRDSFSVNYKSNRRAAGGWYFQLNTKTILLVTNLVIGKDKKMLIDEVIDGFKRRGIHFDLKSRSALLKVYENIGNIEKLSDSGDAVYVKSTI